MFAVQDPVLRGTLQLVVYQQDLRLRHVDVALGRVGVQVVDVALESRRRWADCRDGFQVLVRVGVGAGECAGGEGGGEEEGGGGDLHGGWWWLELSMDVFWLVKEMVID